jgi:hypothetical protein
MSLWKILVIIAVVTMSVILITLVITACVVAGLETKREGKDSAVNEAKNTDSAKSTRLTEPEDANG